MKKDMRILDLSLTYHWYDMIASGEKKEEYREVKEFYIKRLCSLYSTDSESRFKHYDVVRFHRGQGGKETMLVEFKGVYIGYGKHPEWGAPSDKPVFIIELGKVIEKS